MNPIGAKYVILVGLFATLTMRSATIDETYPVITQRDVPIQREDGILPILLDYELIRKTYPKETGKLSNQEIDSWAKIHLSFMRFSQVYQSNYPDGEKLSEPIPVSADQSNLPTAHQPEAFGRALVFDFGGTLIEVKGVGAKDPTTEKDGLLTVPVSVKEMVIAKLLAEVFRHAGIDVPIVPHLGSTASSFEIPKLNKPAVLAGKLWRAPTLRGPIEKNQVNWFATHEQILSFESLFNLYGISTGDDSRPFQSWLNVQQAKDRSLFDFGHFQVSDSFSSSAYQVYGPVNNPARRSSVRFPLWENRQFIGSQETYPETFQPWSNISIPILGKYKPGNDLIYKNVMNLLYNSLTTIGYNGLKFKQELNSWVESLYKDFRSKHPELLLTMLTKNKKWNELEVLMKSTYRALPVNEEGFLELKKLASQVEIPMHLRQEAGLTLLAQLADLKNPVAIQRKSEILSLEVCAPRVASVELLSRAFDLSREKALHLAAQLKEKGAQEILKTYLLPRSEVKRGGALKQVRLKAYEFIEYDLEWLPKGVLEDWGLAIRPSISRYLLSPKFSEVQKRTLIVQLGIGIVAYEKENPSLEHKGHENAIFSEETLGPDLYKLFVEIAAGELYSPQMREDISKLLKYPVRPVSNHPQSCHALSKLPL